MKIVMEDEKQESMICRVVVSKVGGFRIYI